MISDFFSFAFTNLKQRQRRSLLTMIGIFIGIAAVIALISLGQGLKTAINEQFSVIGADKIIVMPKSAAFAPPGSLAPGKITKDDIKLLENVDGVELAAGRLLEAARVEYNDIVIITFLVSLPEDSKERELISQVNTYKAKEGRMLTKNDRGKIMIGRSFNLKGTFEKQLMPGNNILVNNKKFEIAGILDTLGDPERDNSILMNEEDMRELLEIPDEYNVLIAKISNPEDIDFISENIKKAFRKDRNLKEGKEDIEVQTPQQLLNSFNAILNIVQAVLIGIAGISLLVGGIGIMNTMYTSVVERTKEIGILKAIGATKKDIMTLFLIESGMIGLVGGIIGVIIGIALSKGVEFAAYQAFGSSLIRAEVNSTMIIFALIFSFLVGTISGLMPAKKAAELQPIEALRYE